MKDKPKYWYMRYLGECPVCGKDKSYKVRVTDEPKPADPQKRVYYLDDTSTYDWCDA